MKNIRNFCIIAHIDHGKSTLADRLLEFTNTLNQREMQSQVLDDMDLEREKGITIKSHAIQMEYKAKDGQTYVLNLIDTPGHVDFSYEVSRAIASCEGALLVVDATQGIQAQTISNLYLALGNDLEIIPVLNKIDMDSAMVDEVKDQVVDLLGCDYDDILCASGKTGEGVDAVLEAIVNRIPAPKGDENEPLQALIFDSVFNPFRGVIAYFRVFNGKISKGEHVKFFNTGSEYDADEVGVLKLKMSPRTEIKAGDVGYISASIKTVSDISVGDTITEIENQAEPLPGYREMEPMVYCGIYPIDNAKYNDLKEALEKLKLNDDSIVFEPETSQALGFGFRCGFLGLLHMEIVMERLEREFDIGLITTSPSVIYKVHRTNGEIIELYNPVDLPPTTEISFIEEPIMKVEITTPEDYFGDLMGNVSSRRGNISSTDDRNGTKVIDAMIPLSEMFGYATDLRSRTQGRGNYTMQFDHYDEVPKSVAEKIIGERAVKNSDD